MNKDINEEIRQRIRTRRKEKKLTQQNVADKIGETLSNYRKIETISRVLVENAVKIADALDTDFDYLVFGGTKTIDFTPIEPQLLKASAPKGGLEKLYDSIEPTPLFENRQKKYIEVNATEEALLKTYKVLSKDNQKAVRDFINSIKKGK